MKIAIYLRCASSGQGDPIGEQRARLTQEANKKGWEVTE